VPPQQQLEGALLSLREEAFQEMSVRLRAGISAAQDVAQAGQNKAQGSGGQVTFSDTVRVLLYLLLVASGEIHPEI
jgi:hypothetical protein